MILNKIIRLSYVLLFVPAVHSETLTVECPDLLIPEGIHTKIQVHYQTEWPASLRFIYYDEDIINCESEKSNINCPSFSSNWEIKKANCQNGSCNVNMSFLPEVLRNSASISKSYRDTEKVMVELTSRKQTKKQCDFKIYAPGNSACDGDNSTDEMNVTCISNRIYPKAICDWNVLFNKQQITEIVVDEDHTNAAYNNRTYYNSTCSLLLLYNDTKLQSGTYNVTVTIYPNVTGNVTDKALGKKIYLTRTIAKPSLSVDHCTKEVELRSKVNCTCVGNTTFFKEDSFRWYNSDDELVVNGSELTFTANSNTTEYFCKAIYTKYSTESNVTFKLKILNGRPTDIDDDESTSTPASNVTTKDTSSPKAVPDSMILIIGSTLFALGVLLIFVFFIVRIQLKRKNSDYIIKHDLKKLFEKEREGLYPTVTVNNSDIYYLQPPKKPVKIANFEDPYTTVEENSNFDLMVPQVSADGSVKRFVFKGCNDMNVKKSGHSSSPVDFIDPYSTVEECNAQSYRPTLAAPDEEVELPRYVVNNTQYTSVMLSDSGVTKTFPRVMVHDEMDEQGFLTPETRRDDTKLKRFIVNQSQYTLVTKPEKLTKIGTSKESLLTDSCVLSDEDDTYALI